MRGEARAQAQASPQPVDLVDPFIGTDGTGHTFPGPSYPFGMVQPGPDNADSGWAFTSGYQYRAPSILGFSQNRASGTGIPELGDVLLQPSQTRRETLASGYDKASEQARPGYYAVTLSDNQVRVELTSSLRTAFPPCTRWARPPSSARPNGSPTADSTSSPRAAGGSACSRSTRS